MSPDHVLAGRYELHQAIGRGGMGQVWAATDTRLRRQVAVKTVALDAASDPVVAERFEQEARATAALSHPNIVTIFDTGVDDGTAYIVMELLRGTSLEEMVREHGALDIDRALDYAGQVASALAAAHAAGIVHRDIKPSNLMLDGRGTLKVVDFGIARLDQERSGRLTATATVVGSAPYLSPEQATGGTATPQSDLYSLGCVLVTLLTGRPPFAGEHPLSVLHQHLSTPPELPSARRPEVGPAVDQLVAQLLAKSPADRPASARDVADRIQAIRRGHAGTSSLTVAGAEATQVLAPPVVTARADPSTVPAVPVVPVVPAEPEPRRRGAAGWVVGLLVALAVLGALAWALLNLRGGSTPVPGVTVTSTASSSTAPTTPARPAAPTSSTSTTSPTRSRTTVTEEPTPPQTTTRTRTSTWTSTAPTPVVVTATQTVTAEPTSQKATTPTTEQGPAPEATAPTS